METNQYNKRRSIRFAPDINTVVYLHSLGEEEIVSHIGMVYQESARGFGAIFTHKIPREGSFCFAQLGNLPVLKSQIKWVLQLDPHTYKVGFEYID